MNYVGIHKLSTLGFHIGIFIKERTPAICGQREQLWKGNLPLHMITFDPDDWPCNM